MALAFPIPAPPRTPTPPEDDPADMAGLGLDGVMDFLSPSTATFDPNALSPMTEHFNPGRYGSNSQPLSPASPNSQYSFMSVENNGSIDETLQENKGPFNFKPMPLAKSPITKSVSIQSMIHLQTAINGFSRVSANVGVTNTNTVVSPIRYFSSQPLALPSLFQTLYRSPLLKNAGTACLGSKTPDFGGL